MELLAAGSGTGMGDLSGKGRGSCVEILDIEIEKEVARLRRT